jgi:hypothetical protein
MNDREKLDVWNNICIKHGWAKPRELEQWLLKNSIRFTAAGDAIPDESYKLDNVYNTQTFVDGVPAEHLATLVLEALVGALIFPNMEIDKAFWKVAVKRFKEEFELPFPKAIIPKYVFEKPVKRLLENKEDENPKTEEKDEQ